jgi:OOP family OmpA-OmpF porin
MKTSNRNTVISLACALAFSTLSSVAFAQSAARDSGYVYANGGAVLMTASGLCVHTSSGPAVSNLQCDPAPVAQYVAPVQPVARAAPVVVAQAKAPAPAPAPVIVAAIKPAPVMVKVTLDADTLFDFDKSSLRPEGRTALDTFAARLKDINPEVITAVGHADRIGTGSYNQRLSEQRVASVKDYLVAKGIADNRIHTEGKGENQPVTKSADCAGPKSSKVIACLQPDRRVELQVIGTRAQQ